MRLIENKRILFAAEKKEWTVESWKKIMWSHLAGDGSIGMRKEPDWSGSYTLMIVGSSANRRCVCVGGGGACLFSPFQTHLDGSVKSSSEAQSRYRTEPYKGIFIG